MKHFLRGVFLGALGAGLLISGLVSAAPTVLPVNQGGTGTSTKPTYGQLLMGTASGTYSLVATSSLGITQDLSSYLKTSYTALATSTFGSLLGTNIWSGANTFSSLTTITSTQVIMSNTGTPYFTLQDWINTTQSSGRIEGGTILATGTTTISVSAGNGIMKKLSNSTSTALFVSWPSANLTIATGTTYYIYVDYDGGAPFVSSTSDRTTINKNSQFVLGAAYSDGYELAHDVTTGMNATNWTTDEHSRIVELNRVQRASGATVGEVGQRYLSTTAGVMYVAGVRQTFGAKNTSSTDTFVRIFRNGTGGWNHTYDLKQVSSTVYDDGTGVVATLSPNQYGIHWIWLLYDGDIYDMLGQGSYTLAQAQAAGVPTTLSSELSDFGILAAKIIVQRNATNFTEIDSAYTQAFPSAVSVTHSDLANLTWSTAGHTFDTLVNFGGQTINNIALVSSTNANFTSATTTNLNSSGGLSVGNTSTLNAFVNIQPAASSGDIFWIASSTGSNILRVHSNGNTGLGVIVPLAKLHTEIGNPPAGKLSVTAGTTAIGSISDVINTAYSLDATYIGGTVNIGTAGIAYRIDANGRNSIGVFGYGAGGRTENYTAGGRFVGEGFSSSSASGVRAFASSSFGTNAYGVLIDNSGGPGTNWGLYQSGADDFNYFAGNVLIGTTTNNSYVNIQASTTNAGNNIFNIASSSNSSLLSIASNGTLTVPGNANLGTVVFTTTNNTMYSAGTGNVNIFLRNDSANGLIKLGQAGTSPGMDSFVVKPSISGIGFGTSTFINGIFNYQAQVTSTNIMNIASSTGSSVFIIDGTGMMTVPNATFTNATTTNLNVSGTTNLLKTPSTPLVSSTYMMNSAGVTVLRPNPTSTISISVTSATTTMRYAKKLMNALNSTILDCSLGASAASGIQFTLFYSTNADGSGASTTIGTYIVQSRTAGVSSAAVASIPANNYLIIQGVSASSTNVDFLDCNLAGYKTNF